MIVLAKPSAESPSVDGCFKGNHLPQPRLRLGRQAFSPRLLQAERRRSMYLLLLAIPNRLGRRCLTVC